MLPQGMPVSWSPLNWQCTPPTCLVNWSQSTWMRSVHAWCSESSYIAIVGDSLILRPRPLRNRWSGIHCLHMHLVFIIFPVKQSYMLLSTWLFNWYYVISYSIMPCFKQIQWLYIVIWFPKISGKLRLCANSGYQATFMCFSKEHGLGTRL